MSDDNEVKGTRGFIVTTEPDAKSKDFIAQYLKDKAIELILIDTAAVSYTHLTLPTSDLV